MEESEGITEGKWADWFGGWEEERNGDKEMEGQKTKYPIILNININKEYVEKNKKQNFMVNILPQKAQLFCQTVSALKKA